MNWLRWSWDKLVRWQYARDTRRLIRSWWNGLDAEPYVVEIGVPSTTDLTALKIQEIRRLVAAYTFQTLSGHLKLISHWQSETAYRLSQTIFFTRLGIPAGTLPSAEGHQLHAVVGPPKLGWLRRHVELVIGIVGVLAAIIGNVEKIRDPLLALVLAPSVEISTPRKALDVLAGEEFDIEFTTRNVSDWVSCDVNLQDISTEPRDAVTLDTTLPAHFIGLKPGSTEAVKVHGVTTSAVRDALIDVQVVFAGDAKTWVSWNKKRLADGDPAERQFHLLVWPRRTTGIKEIGEIKEGKRCRIDCQFMIGDEFAKGFEVQAQLTDPEDVCFDRIQFLGYPQLDQLNETQLVQVRWLATEIKPRKRYQFSLYAKGQIERNHEQWQKIVQRVTFAFGTPATK